MKFLLSTHELSRNRSILTAISEIVLTSRLNTSEIIYGVANQITCDWMENSQSQTTFLDFHQTSTRAVFTNTLSLLLVRILRVNILFSQSSKNQDTCEDFIQHLLHRNQSSQKETGNINQLKGYFFQISFPQTNCLQELFFPSSLFL